ncbi:WD repeat-containing protein 90 [Desmophyllum pertusum]|uniref:WD repeat-containing protein 90 n=1 Tax=Desmophyllum pertusum TaxID=174260 RepID=A0A9W9Z3N2_9CNID|nr:WD repeat-containing protein 90 [Desmophyllum pertusum]
MATIKSEFEANLNPTCNSYCSSNCGGHGAVSPDGDGEEVHVYAHPSKTVTNLQQHRQKDKVERMEIPKATKAGNFTTLKPDPILSLKRVVGFGGGTFREALWTKNGSCIVYPCHAIIVSIDVSSGQQQFFMGHTDKVLLKIAMANVGVGQASCLVPAWLEHRKCGKFSL